MLSTIIELRDVDLKIRIVRDEDVPRELLRSQGAGQEKMSSHTELSFPWVPPETTLEVPVTPRK